MPVAAEKKPPYYLTKGQYPQANPAGYNDLLLGILQRQLFLNNQVELQYAGFGNFLQLPDGSVTNPAAAWINDQFSGTYRVSSGLFAESVNKTQVWNWNSTRMQFAPGYFVDVQSLTTGQVVFPGSGGRLSGSASLFWDNANLILTVGGLPAANIAPFQVTSAIPAGQTCTGAFGVGSTGISFNMNNPGVLFNAYFDGTSFRSMATGFTGIWRMNAATGLMRWATGPTVVGIGTVSAQTDRFSITNTGLVGIGTNSQSTALWIGDGTINATNILSFGKYEAATESNQPLIQMKSVIAAGVSQDLALAAQSTSGGIVFYTGLPTTPFTIGAGSSAIRGFINASGNWAIGATGSFGSGTVVLFIANATVTPSANPVGGGIIYVEAGALKYRGSGGTTTVLGVA